MYTNDKYLTYYLFYSKLEDYIRNDKLQIIMKDYEILFLITQTKIFFIRLKYNLIIIVKETLCNIWTYYLQHKLT